MGTLRGADLFSLAAGPPCRSGDDQAETKSFAVIKNQTGSHQMRTGLRDEPSPVRLQIALQGDGSKLTPCVGATNSPRSIVSSGRNVLITKTRCPCSSSCNRTSHPHP